VKCKRKHLTRLQSSQAWYAAALVRGGAVTRYHLRRECKWRKRFRLRLIKFVPSGGIRFPAACNETQGYVKQHWCLLSKNKILGQDSDKEEKVLWVSQCSKLPACCRQKCQNFFCSELRQCSFGLPLTVISTQRTNLQAGLRAGSNFESRFCKSL